MAHTGLRLLHQRCPYHSNITSLFLNYFSIDCALLTQTSMLNKLLVSHVASPQTRWREVLEVVDSFGPYLDAISISCVIQVRAYVGTGTNTQGLGKQVVHLAMCSICRGVGGGGCAWTQCPSAASYRCVGTGL